MKPSKTNDSPAKKKGEKTAPKAGKHKRSDTGTDDDTTGKSFILNDTESPPYGLSPLQKIAKIRSGISKKELSSIKNAASLDYDTLSQLLSVGRATLINKKSSERFNINISEKILALADLYSYGYAVFGDVERFNRWMKEPNLALGNKAPVELADTLAGIEEIKHVIGRIEYGIFS